MKVPLPGRPTDLVSLRNIHCGVPLCYLNVTSYIGQTGGNHYSCVFNLSADREWTAPILPMVTVCSERRAFISAFEIWGAHSLFCYGARKSNVLIILGSQPIGWNHENTQLKRIPREKSPKDPMFHWCICRRPRPTGFADPKETQKSIGIWSLCVDKPRSDDQQR